MRTNNLLKGLVVLASVQGLYGFSLAQLGPRTEDKLLGPVSAFEYHIFQLSANGGKKEKIEAGGIIYSINGEMTKKYSCIDDCTIKNEDVLLYNNGCLEEVQSFNDSSTKMRLIRLEKRYYASDCTLNRVERFSRDVLESIEIYKADTSIETQYYDNGVNTGFSIKECASKGVCETKLTKLFPSKSESTLKEVELYYGNGQLRQRTTSIVSYRMTPNAKIRVNYITQIFFNDKGWATKSEASISSGADGEMSKPTETVANYEYSGIDAQGNWTVMVEKFFQDEKKFSEFIVERKIKYKK